MKTKLEINRLRPYRKAKQTRKPEKLARLDQSTLLLKLKRILVPIDFSEASLKALRYAVPFAERFGATICLVYVIEQPFFPGKADNLAMRVPQRALVESGREKLLSLADLEIEELVPVSVDVRMGKSFDQIDAVAKEREIDLIIIATRGHTGLKHVLLGSTTEQVVRHAPCPVLVVREPEREFI